MQAIMQLPECDRKERKDFASSHINRDGKNEIEYARSVSEYERKTWKSENTRQASSSFILLFILFRKFSWYTHDQQEAHIGIEWMMKLLYQFLRMRRTKSSLNCMSLHTAKSNDRKVLQVAPDRITFQYNERLRLTTKAAQSVQNLVLSSSAHCVYAYLSRKLEHQCTYDDNSKE